MLCIGLVPFIGGRPDLAHRNKYASVRHHLSFESVAVLNHIFLTKRMSNIDVYEVTHSSKILYAITGDWYLFRILK